MGGVNPPPVNTQRLLKIRIVLVRVLARGLSVLRRGFLGFDITKKKGKYKKNDLLSL